MPRDPRLSLQLQQIRNAPRQLFIGALVMAASGLIGTVVFAQEQSSFSVLQVINDIPAGAEITSADIKTTTLPLRLASEVWLQKLTAGVQAARALRAGELLYVSDITVTDNNQRLVAAELTSAQLPTSTHAGDQVQLWNANVDNPTLLTDLAVVWQLATNETTGNHNLVLAVGEGDLPAVLAALAANTLVVVA